jgi:hypothetical protein
LIARYAQHHYFRSRSEIHFEFLEKNICRIWNVINIQCNLPSQNRWTDRRVNRVLEKRGNEVCKGKWMVIKARCMECGKILYNKVVEKFSMLLVPLFLGLEMVHGSGVLYWHKFQFLGISSWDSSRYTHDLLP